MNYSSMHPYSEPGEPSTTWNLPSKTALGGSPPSYLALQAIGNGRFMQTPLERALVKCEQLERDLRKSPDFQLYMLTESPRDRARMENIMMEIPQFALWHALRTSVEVSRSEPRACQPSELSLSEIG